MKLKLSGRAGVQGVACSMVGASLAGPRDAGVRYAKCGRSLESDGTDYCGNVKDLRHVFKLVCSVVNFIGCRPPRLTHVSSAYTVTSHAGWLVEGPGCAC